MFTKKIVVDFWYDLMTGDGFFPTRCKANGHCNRLDTQGIR